MRNRIFLGTNPGEGYGYKRPVKVYVNIELRAEDAMNPLRVRRTTEHMATILEPELSITFDVVNSAGTDLGGGAMGKEGLNVETRKASSRVFEVLHRLIPWHLNGMQAKCAHQGPPVYEQGRYGPQVNFQKSPRCPLTGYGYGSAWLVEPLPWWILRDIESLMPRPL